MTIQTLIDGAGAFEVIRDKISAILFENFENQKLIAVDEAVDPSTWDVRIYRNADAYNEAFLNSLEDLRPHVNVCFDKSEYHKKGSDIHEKQVATSVFHVDVFACAVSKSEDVGFSPGYSLAKLRAQRVAHICRSILMAQENFEFALRPTILDRWVSGLMVMELDRKTTSLQNVAVCRIILEVNHFEFSPQMLDSPLEFIHIEFEESGSIIAIKDIDYAA